MSSSPAAPPSVRPRRVVTDRRGGRSRSPYDSFNLGDHVGDDPADVAANRARVARELGVAEDRLVWMNQVHGTGVAVVDGPQDGAGARDRRAGHLDARSRALRPGGRLRADPADGSGRRGRRRRARGAGGGPAGRPAGHPVRDGEPGCPCAPRDRAAGPGGVRCLLRGACCDAADVARVAPAAAVATRTGTPGLDLRAGLAETLQKAGVSEVVHDPRCTVEDPNLFSHRRDGVTGQAGRLAGLARRRGPA